MTSLHETVESLRGAFPSLDLPAFEILCSTARLLLQDGDPDTLCQAVFATLRDSHSVDIYFHYLVTMDGKRLRLASAGGSQELRDAIGSHLEFGSAECDAVAMQQQSLCISSALDHSDGMMESLRSVGARYYACYPLRTNGRPLGTLSFGSTTRNRFEQRELDLFALIAEQVTLATERRRQIGQLQELERLASAGRMSATLAHEINNPLHCLQSCLEELSGEVGSPEAKRLLETASRQTDHLSDITQRALQMFRGVQATAVRCDLSGLVQELVLDARLPRHARLVSAIEPALWVYAVPGELRQVIFNLLLNAAQFSPAGREVRLDLRRATTTAEIRVTDQGPGILAAAHDRIFQPFFTTRGSEGTGIGLWASREMVRRIGGDMSFSSDPEHAPGAAFVVSLPLAA
jgi:signal transduction histidine kinase